MKNVLLNSTVLSRVTRRSATFQNMTDSGEASMTMLQAFGQNDRTYSFDASMMFSDNAAAYTASGNMQVGGADAIIDLGGNQGVTPKQQARIDAVAIFDVTAITVSGTNTYQLDILLSNDPAFGVGTVVCAGGLQLGKGTSLRNTSSLDSVIGRYEVPFTNEVAGTKFQYMKVALTGANSPSISILGFVAVLPEP